MMGIIHDSIEYRVIVSPDYWKSKDAAEKILTQCGINKPKEVEEKEKLGLSFF